MMYPGEAHPEAKLRNADVIAIRKLRRAGVVQSAIARRYRVHQSTISRVCQQRTWRHL